MGWLAFGWGVLAASAVIIGATAGWLANLPDRIVAGIMAFGCGVLLAIVAFDTLDEAYMDGGLGPTVLGIIGGAFVFSIGLLWLDRAGAKHRKRSRHAIVRPPAAAGIVALATVLDTIPESLIIGLNFADGERVATATLIAVFLSNIPESLSTTTRMRRGGHGLRYVVTVWACVILSAGVATFVGYQTFIDLSDAWTGVLQAIAAGALLALIVDAMIPEAYSETHAATGMIISLGFAAGFALTHGFV